MFIHGICYFQWSLYIVLTFIDVNGKKKEANPVKTDRITSILVQSLVTWGTEEVLRITIHVIMCKLLLSMLIMHFIYMSACVLKKEVSDSAKNWLKYMHFGSVTRDFVSVVTSIKRHLGRQRMLWPPSHGNFYLKFCTDTIGIYIYSSSNFHDYLRKLKNWPYWVVPPLSRQNH
jgi:hypothetical protein